MSIAREDQFDRAVFLLRHARRNLKTDAEPALAEMIDQFFKDNMIIPASLVTPMEAFEDFVTGGHRGLEPLQPHPDMPATGDA